MRQKQLRLALLENELTKRKSTTSSLQADVRGLRGLLQELESKLVNCASVLSFTSRMLFQLLNMEDCDRLDSNIKVATSELAPPPPLSSPSKSSSGTAGAGEEIDG